MEQKLGKLSKNEMNQQLSPSIGTTDDIRNAKDPGRLRRERDRGAFRFRKGRPTRQHKQAVVGLILLVGFVLAGLAQPLIFIYWSRVGAVPSEAEKGLGHVSGADWQAGQQTAQVPGHHQTLAQIYDPIRGIDLRMQGGVLLNHPSPPSRLHPLGTDPLGRDVLSQLLYSIRIELAFGVGSALTAVGIALLVGGVAAYVGGVVDTSLMRLADLVLILPKLAFLVFIAAFISLNLFQLALVYGILGGLGGRAIVFRAQGKGVQIRSYVEVSRGLGGSPWHILSRHILPDLLPLAFFYLMTGVSEAILAEATLAFLGLLKTPVSWGLMMETARQFGYSLGQAWWLYFPAGLMITFFCGSFYLIGQGLDLIWSPQLRVGNFEGRGEQ